MMLCNMINKNKPSYFRRAHIGLIDQGLPELVRLRNDGGGKVCALGISIKRKLILWLAIGYFVDLGQIEGITLIKYIYIYRM